MQADIPVYDREYEHMKPDERSAITYTEIFLPKTLALVDIQNTKINKLDLNSLTDCL